MRITNPDGVAFEDLTARARIRDAALRYFTEYGFDRATIREIARAAGVSPGLVRHHFGSKEDLRNACDAYALQALRAYFDQVMTDDGPSDSRSFGEPWNSLHPIRRYMARALIDDSAAVGQIFDEMVTMTEQSLRQTDKHRSDQPVADLRARAALTVAMTMGVPAFQAHIGRAIGADLFSPEGDRRVILAMLDIQSHPAIDPDAAVMLREALEKEPAGRGQEPMGRGQEAADQE